MKTKNRWNSVFGVLLTSLIIFAILFGTPIVGSYNADFLFEDALGCSVSSGLFDNHDASHTCLFYGLDVSDKVAAYSTPILSQFMTPYTFILAFYDLLIIWIIMLLIAFNKSSPTVDNRTLFNNILYWIFISFPFILVILILMSPMINKYSNYEVRRSNSQHVKPIENKSSNNNVGNSIRF
jgi:hypothetical protein